MSLATEIQTATSDVKGFFTKLVTDVKTAKAIWTGLNSPQTRALFVKVGTDVIKTVKDAGAAAAAEGFSITLDATVIADAKQLVADAEAGEPEVVADLALLGIKL